MKNLKNIPSYEMKIPPPRDNLLFESSIRRQLEMFIGQPEPSAIAPCSGCNQHEPANCAPACERAPGALSIDPEQYPIEPKIVGLVYEVNACRVLQTCYSCEGHFRNDKLWKIPQVSFYSDAPIYVKLVLIHLDRLYLKKVLSYCWHIVLIDMAQTLNLTYSIQPDLNNVEKHHLGKLQQDLKILSINFHSELKNIASELLTKAKNAA